MADASSDVQQEEGTDEWAQAMAEQTTAPVPPPRQAPVVAPAANLFNKLSGGTTSGTPTHDIQLVLDIPVALTVELGRTKIPIRHILQLAQGSVIELDGLAGEPMDVLVNGCLIAQGEVVVVNEKFGIRLTDIITPSERMRKLNR